MQRTLLAFATVLAGAVVSAAAWVLWPGSWLTIVPGVLTAALLWTYGSRIAKRLDEATTDRRSLEQRVDELSSAERRLRLFRSVVDSSAEMIYVFRPEDGTIVYANDSLSRETGLSLPELINRPLGNQLDGFVPAASGTAWKRWTGASEDGKLIAHEATHRTADGRRFPVSVRASRIEHETQELVVAVIEDITERKQRETELVRTQEKLTHLSRMDGLLGIANRRHFDEAFEREWNRAARQGAFLSLVLADIDEFKPYNDRYGHPAGDDCLRRVAEVFRRSIFRPADLVARYGGEELAVLLPETEAIGAKLVAEDLRAGVQALSLAHESSAVAKEVTISLGVGTIRPSPATSPGEFLRSVDRALYRAKELGRNRVEQTKSIAIRSVKASTGRKGSTRRRAT